MNQQLTYALVLAASISIPMLRSFESRIYFRQYWRALFTGVGIMMIIFITWDVLFTRHGIWGFNHQYVAGVFFLGLPLEEWAFFIAIPYCVVFSYEVVRYFMPNLFFPKASRMISFVLGILLVVIGIFNSGRTYTMLVMLLCGTLVLIQPVLGNHKTWLTHFYATYLITLPGFFIVNGILTSLPVVWYNDTHNLGIRLGAIPVEDSAYFMAMMLLVMMVYERMKHNQRHAFQ